MGVAAIVVVVVVAVVVVVPTGTVRGPRSRSCALFVGIDLQKGQTRQCGTCQDGQRWVVAVAAAGTTVAVLEGHGRRQGRRGRALGHWGSTLRCRQKTHGGVDGTSHLVAIQGSFTDIQF